MSKILYKINGIVSRRSVLGGLGAGVAWPVWADAVAQSPRPMRRVATEHGPGAVIEQAKLGGVFGYAVADAVTGQILESVEADRMMPPASVAKVVTALFGLEVLGPEHRFATRVLRSGPVSAGRLDGDLVLSGGSDPTLDSDTLGDLVAALAATGLRQVTGRFLVCTGPLPQRDRIAPDQPDHLGYDPAVSGLCLNFNRVNFIWKQTGKSWDINMVAEGERFSPEVSMAQMVVIPRDLPLFTYALRDGEERWTVASTALGAAGSRWLPVRQPSVYVGEVFASLCRAQGIELKPAVVVDVVDVVPKGAVDLVRRDSDDLAKVLKGMLRFSTNLTAEVVGLAATGAGTQQGSAAVVTDWARRRFGVTGHFADHSGLGSATRISARDMLGVMLAARGGALAGLLHETGLVDAKGKEVKDNPVRVLAKSGTMNFVSGLAGFVVPPEGRPLAFAMFMADVPRREAVPVADREEPEGNEAWVKRARRLQKQMLRRWVQDYVSHPG